MGYNLPGACALMAGAAVVLAASPALAQPRIIGWDDIVQRVEEHPRVREAGARAAAARAGVEVAGSIPNPSLEIDLGRGTPREGSAAARFEQAYALSIPLDWLAGRGPRIDVARAGVEEAGAEGRALRREVLAELGNLYWNLAYDQARVASLEKHEAQAAEVARLVTLRVERGEARPIEVPRVEIEQDRVVIELSAARSRLAAHRGQFEIWLPGLAGQDWALDSRVLEKLPEPSGSESSLAKIDEGHPDLEAGRARLRGLASEAVVERRQRLPSVALKAFAEDELDRQAFGAGLEISLPLWNWNSGRISQVEALREAERSRLDARQRQLRAEAEQARSDCLQGRLTTERYRERILPRATKAADVLERSFQVGETTLLDTLDAQRTLGETRREYLAALLQAQLDCHRFQLFLGETR